MTSEEIGQGSYGTVIRKDAQTVTKIFNTSKDSLSFDFIRELAIYKQFSKPNHACVPALKNFEIEYGNKVSFDIEAGQMDLKKYYEQNIGKYLPQESIDLPRHSKV